jgi:hypothetical protein
MATADRTTTCRSCLENGLAHHHVRVCRAYSAQAAFGRLMARLTADAGHTVRTAPASPDYSTRAAVDARIREAGTQELRANVVTDTAFARLYRAFRKASPALVCRVEDLHVSRWRIVRDAAGRTDLMLARPSVAA